MKWCLFKERMYNESRRFFTPINKLIFKMNGIQYEEGLQTKGRIRVFGRGTGMGVITMGKNVRINSAHWTAPIGASDRTMLFTVDSGEIIIKDNVGITNASIAAQTRVTIEENVLLGAGTQIYDTDFHPLHMEYRTGGVQDHSKIRTREIRIGKGSFLGAGCVIMKGTQIGENCVIAAHSVVSGKIPDNQIWGGNPAKYLKDNTL